MVRFDAIFAGVPEFLAAWDGELARKGLLVRGATVGPLPPMAPCRVAITVAGAKVHEFDARVAAVVPGVGVAVMLDQVPAELAAFAERARRGEVGCGGAVVEEAAGEGSEEEAPPTGPVSERLKALSVSQKMSLALTCDRETRFALLRDPNKALHLYVLRNPRFGLDEVQAAAKMPSLSPDAMKFIADHRDWGMNGTVCTALVRNPRTPLPIALKLIDRVPPGELRAIAKGGAREQLVQAARKRVSG